ncbi:hypothetical protein EYR41_010383 [Orbilia oligospora]|uniref:Uncharacterized protein n=1 Tax=Orbilia oligospora TaxID=2813651 RepID=A0A8H2HK17_ORBOL|nr:hypothetical protein TWF132_009404 [Orbilia oligospora]TGJ64320.1 hypothetical protein EYR41_010383 [Orbilia oligospora]
MFTKAHFTLVNNLTGLIVFFLSYQDKAPINRSSRTISIDIILNPRLCLRPDFANIGPASPTSRAIVIRSLEQADQIPELLTLFPHEPNGAGSDLGNQVLNQEKALWPIKEFLIG